MDKAHIEHLIRFIEYQHFGAVQINGFAVNKVHQTARCRHQNICAPLQQVDLLVDGLTTNDRVHLKRCAGHIDFQVVANLVHQLAGWGQHEGLDCFGHRLADLVHQQFCHWQAKSSSFARTRLGKAHHVGTLKYQWNSLRLNWRGFVKAGIGNVFHKLGVKPQHGKVGHKMTLSQKRKRPDHMAKGCNAQGDELLIRSLMAQTEWPRLNPA